MALWPRSPYIFPTGNDSHLGRLTVVVAEFLEPLAQQRIVVEFRQRDPLGVQLARHVGQID